MEQWANILHVSWVYVIVIPAVHMQRRYNGPENSRCEKDRYFITLTSAITPSSLKRRRVLPVNAAITSPISAPKVVRWCLTHWPLGNSNDIFFGLIIFKRNLVIAGWGISREIALIWMSLDLTNDQSKLVQVMAWCRQATSYYLSQFWPSSPSPCGVTRPQWVQITHPATLIICHFISI